MPGPRRGIQLVWWRGRRDAETAQCVLSLLLGRTLRKHSVQMFWLQQALLLTVGTRWKQMGHSKSCVQGGGAPGTCWWEKLVGLVGPLLPPRLRNQLQEAPARGSQLPLHALRATPPHSGGLLLHFRGLLGPRDSRWAPGSRP